MVAAETLKFDPQRHPRESIENQFCFTDLFI